jgi:hypothetical protein
MAAAALGAAAGSEAGAKEAQGAIKTLVEALDKNIISFDWGRDPKTRKLVLQGVHVNVTSGLILGGIALALIWEAGNWFANALDAGKGGALPDLIDLMNPTIPLAEAVAGSAASFDYWLLKALTTNPITGTSLLSTPSGGSNSASSTASKQALMPTTAGQAYNAMVRDAILAGPGTVAAQFRNAITNLIPPT